MTHYVRRRRNGRSMCGNAELIDKDQQHDLCRDCANCVDAEDETRDPCPVQRALLSLSDLAGFIAPVYECSIFAPRRP